MLRLNFAGKIEKAFTLARAQRYLAYHILVDSSPEHKYMPKLDFPGRYAVRKLFEDIIANSVAARPATSARRKSPQRSL